MKKMRESSGREEWEERKENQDVMVRMELRSCDQSEKSARKNKFSRKRRRKS